MKRIIILFLLITSCGSLYDVSTVDNGGIPFINQKIVETETQIYRESFFQVELTQEWEKKEKKIVKVKKGKREVDKEVTASSKYKTTIVRYGTLDCGFEINTIFSGKNNVQEAQGAVEKPLILVPSVASPSSSNNCTFQDKIYDYQSINSILNGTSVNNLSLFLISKSKTQNVRPAEQHYINVKKAVTGSTQATITLNKNGTLTSAGATVQDDLVGKIIDKIPLTEIISSTLKLPATGSEEALGDNDVKVELISISLKLIPIHRDYVLTKDGAPGNNDMISESNLTSFKVKETKGELLVKEAPKKNDKKETIAISGSIVLPKKE